MRTAADPPLPFEEQIFSAGQTFQVEGVSFYLVDRVLLTPILESCEDRHGQREGKASRAA